MSGGVRDQLKMDGIDEMRIDVIHSALDPARMSALSESRGSSRTSWASRRSEIAIGTVGALADHKGQRTLIDAFASLGGPKRRRRGSTSWASASCATSSSAAPAIAASARGCTSSGQREDVPDLLVGWDAFVFPSRSGEGSPAALKEALAAGVPTIASNLVAHAEIGVPEEDLFVAGDAAMLRERLERLLSDSDAALARAAELRPLAARFHPDTLVEETLAVYAKVLE